MSTNACKGKRVFAGLSGGVDSALACALLVEQGYDVTAVYMRNWSRDLPGFKCAWADDLADAERVAVTLGIDLEVWDCEAEYKATVVDYLVDAYARGYTPNPDVMCNQTVKFGTFAERAFAAGADFVATGHYARVAPAAEKGTGDKPAAERPVRLLRAADEHKDQTYFLWRVGADVLARTLFPVGNVPSKAEVRRMCAERGLGVEAKPDSDGICFVGPVGIRPSCLTRWTVAGRHRGVGDWARPGPPRRAFLFTVGQRKGLDLGGGPARYVVPRTSRRTWSTSPQTTRAPRSSAASFARGRPLDRRLRRPRRGGSGLVRTRHTGTLTPVRVEPGTDGSTACLAFFFEPQRRVAPGQSAVIYDGLTCLGGGDQRRADKGTVPCQLSAALLPADGPAQGVSCES